MRRVRPPWPVRPLIRLSALSLILAPFQPGCTTLYYSVWESLGKDKRDLLIDNVHAARDEQRSASKDFKDALGRLQEAYGKSGSKLESTYERLKADYEHCDDKSKALSARIDKIDRIANDLFAEWETEIGSMSSAELRDKSRANLARSKERYAALHRSLERSRASMAPVLVRFHDQVIFLKHNLNAQALGALESERAGIERDVGELLRHMESAIQESETFVSALEKS